MSDQIHKYCKFWYLFLIHPHETFRHNITPHNIPDNRISHTIIFWKVTNNFRTEKLTSWFTIETKSAKTCLTKLMCMLRLRWTAEQSMLRRIPYVMDAQVGFFTLQSKHIWKKTIKKPYNFKNQTHKHTYCRYETRSHKSETKNENFKLHKMKLQNQQLCTQIEIWNSKFKMKTDWEHLLWSEPCNAPPPFTLHPHQKKVGWCHS